MKSALSILALVVAATISLPASASVGDSALRQPGFIAAKAGVPAQQVARRGADDPVNHDINDDKGGQSGKGGKGKGGNDDGPNHT
jgi:hypothetical protein